MNELDFALDTKSIDDEGNIEGLAVGYGDIDQGGDIVLPGAINLAGRKSLPMLLFHDQKRPAGVWNSFKETVDGLLVKGRFSMSTIAGKEAYGLTRDGALQGLSMGFQTIRQRFEGKARQLLEVRLHEVSLVSIPMHDRTRILSVKASLEGGNLPSLPDFEDFLREAGGFSKSQATAIAGKGLAHLLRGEPGSANRGDFWSALRAEIGSA